MRKINLDSDPAQAGTKKLSETEKPAISKMADTANTTKRKPSRAGAITRTQLLDAAELIFADHGYDGTSLRDIAEAGGLHLALSTYHFGTKERLFDEVVHRRATELEQIRLANLASIDPSAQPPADTVRLLIRAYTEPMIEARYGKSAQWQAYVRLMAGLVNNPRWAPTIQKHYDPCARTYVQRWREVLPHADTNSLLNAYSFMVVTMLYVCSNTNRFGKWKRKTPSRGEEVRAMTDDFVQFVHAGFMSLTAPRL